MAGDDTKLQPQELLITLLGNEVLHHDGARVWAGGLVEILDSFGFSTAAARAAIGRLVSRGLLDRHKVGREVFYSLTERARVGLDRDEARILGFTTADGDGQWTWLSYAAPISPRAARDRLRRRLEFLGYGSTGDGIWIAAGDRVPDTDRVLQDLGLQAAVDMFVGRPAPSTDVGRLIDRAWPELGALEAEYADFVRRWAGTDAEPDPLVSRTLLMHHWRQFPLRDPGLADPHLPWASTRTAARDLFHHAWHQLAPGARSAFAALCRVDSTDPVSVAGTA